MHKENYDWVIIGAGPGGYVAAIHAAQKGLKTALIDPLQPGGVCLHEGCIPTKAILASVDLVRQIKGATAFGLEVPDVKYNWSSIMTRRQKVVRQLTQGIRYLLEKNKVDLVCGKARFASPSEILVLDDNNQTCQIFRDPKAVVIATGSRSIDIPTMPRDGNTVINSADVIQLNELPKSMVIIGGGFIGCEYASIFSTLGTQVTIVEGLNGLLPNLDRDLSRTLERNFVRQGIKMLFQTKASHVDDGLVLTSGQKLTADKVLVSIGRCPNVTDLGLDNAGITYSPKGISTDEHFRTSAPNIYAIGDVTGKTALAHASSAQAKRVIDHHLEMVQSDGNIPELSPKDPIHWIPGCVFTNPEIATVGLSEDEAQKQGLKYRVGRFPYAATGKAQVKGEVEGMVKWIADAESGRLLGGHIVGFNAAELIGIMTLAVQCQLTAQQISHCIFAHPTLSEAILESAEGIFGMPTHFVSR